MLFFKIMSLLWPFFRETVLGDKTVMETFRTNKKKCVMIAIVVASFGLNYFTISRIIAISKDHIALLQKYKALEGSKQSPITNNLEVKRTNPDPTPLPVSPVEVKPPTSVIDGSRHARLKARLDEIKAREERGE